MLFRGLHPAWIISWQCLIALLLLNDALIANDADEVLCGPRCVEFVLSQLGRHEELFRIVHEMQALKNRTGVTLNDIRSAIERHGVTTAPIKLRAFDRLAWRFPVVVHVPLTEYDGDVRIESGHFMIWLPSSSTSFVDVWDGLQGVDTVSAGTFYLRISPIVLLVAPSGPIDTSAATESDLTAFVPSAGGALALILTVVIVFLILRRPKHVEM